MVVDGLEGEWAPESGRKVLTYVGRQMAAQMNASPFVFVVRSSPPALAVLGHLDKDDVEDLERRSAQLQSRLRRLRYVSYEQAERDCEGLAERLSRRVGPDVLDEAQFIGIPRGGLIVLGMLSYVLELDHAQIGRPVPSEAPVVVVDDCALSGSRVRRFLDSDIEPDREIVFATLYSHPDLRSAVEQEVPNVTACVSARDLHDYGPDELGDDYTTWQAQWHERHPDDRYWIGRPEHLCFPWSEVDTARWNAETEEVEQGLRLGPPEYCLKNRHSTSPRPSTASVQVQPEPQGPICPSPAVFFGTVDEQVIVAHPDTEVCMTLNGTAADMWHALVEHGTIDRALDALLETYDVDAARLRADLTDYVDTLAARDLLSLPDSHRA